MVIAPDILCKTFRGRKFWIEVKDKPQRFYFPDTGADLHQVIGWYKINKEYKTPVLVIFKDPSFEACVPRTLPQGDAMERFQTRWKKFGGALYGGWLSELITLDQKTKYPCVFSERSRQMDMKILYFHINKMKLLGGFDYIFSALPNEIGELQTYFRDDNKDKHLLREMAEIEKLSKWK